MGLPKLLILFIILLHLSPRFGAQVCLPDQRDALLDFGDALVINRKVQDSRCDGSDVVSSYPKTASWNLRMDCCGWGGVTCDKLTAKTQVCSHHRKLTERLAETRRLDYMVESHVDRLLAWTGTGYFPRIYIPRNRKADMACKPPVKRDPIHSKDAARDGMTTFWHPETSFKFIAGAKFTEL